MAKQVSIKATRRNFIGKQGVKKGRTGGAIPGIVYGSHIQPIPVQVEAKSINQIFRHVTNENILIDLAIEENGKATSRLAFIQEIQHHPTTDRILHLDFHEVKADEKIRVRVPIIPVGEPEGVRTGGGVLEQVMRELEIECLPKDLPEQIQADVTTLQIGGNIHVGELKIPSSVTVISRKDFSVFTVLAPKEEVVEASAEIKEPEVIKQKKAEEATEGSADAPKSGKPEGKADAKPSAKADKK